MSFTRIALHRRPKRLKFSSALTVSACRFVAFGSWQDLSNQTLPENRLSGSDPDRGIGYQALAASEPAKAQLRRPKTTGRITRSAEGPAPFQRGNTNVFEGGGPGARAGSFL
jgi:hypothetical protein